MKFTSGLLVALLFASAFGTHNQHHLGHQGLSKEVKACLESRKEFFESLKNTVGGSSFGIHLIEADDIYKNVQIKTNYKKLGVKITDFLHDPKTVYEGEQPSVVEEVTKLHGELSTKFEELMAEAKKIQYSPELLKAVNALSDECTYVKEKSVLPFYAENFINTNIKKIAVKIFVEKNRFNTQLEGLKIFEMMLKGQVEENPLQKVDIKEVEKKSKPKNELLEVLQKQFASINRPQEAGEEGNGINACKVKESHEECLKRIKSECKEKVEDEIEWNGDKVSDQEKEAKIKKCVDKEMGEVEQKQKANKKQKTEKEEREKLEKESAESFKKIIEEDKSLIESLKSSSKGTGGSLIAERKKMLEGKNSSHFSGKSPTHQPPKRENSVKSHPKFHHKEKPVVDTEQQKVVQDAIKAGNIPPPPPMKTSTAKNHHLPKVPGNLPPPPLPPRNTSTTNKHHSGKAHDKQPEVVTQTPSIDSPPDYPPPPFPGNNQDNEKKEQSHSSPHLPPKHSSSKKERRYSVSRPGGTASVPESSSHHNQLKKQNSENHLEKLLPTAITKKKSHHGISFKKLHFPHGKKLVKQERVRDIVKYANKPKPDEGLDELEDNDPKEPSQDKDAGNYKKSFTSKFKNMFSWKSSKDKDASKGQNVSKKHRILLENAAGIF